MTARILVIDDIASNVRLLEAVLAREYYEVRSIRDGRQAVALARDWQPDVILLDVMMPEMDGYAVCGAIKTSPATSHIPIIMITALRDLVERRQALLCGADEFLSKPVEQEILLARLRSTIRLKRLLDEWHARGATTRSLGLAATAARDISFEDARVLVVDDLAHRAARLRDALMRKRIAVTVAYSEETMPDLPEAGQFGLIVISLSLITLDPLRLVGRLRAADATRDIPLLLVAEPDQRALLITALDLGANDVIVTPLDDGELLLRAGSHIRRKLYQDKLRHDFDNALQLAIMDPLTGLYNRRYLVAHLDALYADQTARRFAVLMVDIDNFKLINDLYGHHVGDRVLKAVADVLRLSLRETDLVARFGGEEFVVVLSASDLEDAAQLAERLRNAVELIATDLREPVTISIGVAMSSVASNAEGLMERADNAMYQAKGNGRNRVMRASGLPDEMGR